MSHPTEGSGCHLGPLAFRRRVAPERYRREVRDRQFAADSSGNRWPFTDGCGVCDHDPTNDCVQDCAGTWGGAATEDPCAVCDADPTNDCVEDCAGTWGGTATIDRCGACDADQTNDCQEDCAGSWGGTATMDECAVCDSDATNDCVPDCYGEWGGTATVDTCGFCSGGATGIEACDGDPTDAGCSCRAGAGDDGGDAIPGALAFGFLLFRARAPRRARSSTRRPARAA